MKKKQTHEVHMSYLYLGILGMLASVGVEMASESMDMFMLPELTTNITVALLYIVSGIMFTAFISSVKLANEQKYVLYLVILALVFFRVYSLIGGTMM